MLNIIWPIFIIMSIIFGIISGNIEQLNNAFFEGAEEAVTTTLTLLGSMCLWNGIMSVASKTSFITKIEKLIKPLIKVLFPDLKDNKQVKEEISMNIVANVLGMGNAATPLGLKAMNTLQKDNKNKKELNNSMIMLIVLNTASLQVIPTTVIAIRNALGSNNPTKMIIPVWIATIIAAISGIIVTKMLIKISEKKGCEKRK